MTTHTDTNTTGKVIPPYTFDQFVEKATWFHSYPAPGILVGGFMVAEAQRHIPEGTLYNAISETSWCLPDSIQMLTPCTIGNGWMKVLDLGVYALSLFDKYSGEGVRVAIDPEKLKNYPDMYIWLYKSKPKPEQDSKNLRKEIELAGTSILSVEKVLLSPSILQRRSKGGIATCPLCGDAYPERYGSICRRCQGEAPYMSPVPVEGAPTDPAIESPLGKPKTVSVEESVGKKILHDMTRIVPGESKGVEFERGHVVTAGDVCRLQQMGRYNIHVEQDCPEGYIHEDDAAKAFAAAMSGPGTRVSGPPHEGKVQILADRDGLLVVRENLLETFNTLTDVMAASRQPYTIMNEGRAVAATRAIPLFLKREHFDRSMALLETAPLFEVKTMRQARVGLLITGNEVFHGLIEDKFQSIITGKVVKQGCEVVKTIIAPDDADQIARGVEELADAGCDLLVTTAGLSVDPDDLTRKGLVQAGVTDMLYGMPVLPGTMTLVAKRGDMQVIGVPACALFYKTTTFDLLLPRLLASVPITRKEMARHGAGGLCMQCTKCIYPKCPFGK